MPPRIENDQIALLQGAHARGANRLPRAEFEPLRQQQAARADVAAPEPAARPEQNRRSEEVRRPEPASIVLNEQLTNGRVRPHAGTEPAVPPVGLRQEAEARPARVELAERNQFPQRLVQLLNEVRGRSSLEELVRPQIALALAAVEVEAVRQPAEAQNGEFAAGAQVETEGTQHIPLELPAAPPARLTEPGRPTIVARPAPGAAAGDLARPGFFRTAVIEQEIQQLHARQVFADIVHDRVAREDGGVGAPAIERTLIDQTI